MDDPRWKWLDPLIKEFNPRNAISTTAKILGCMHQTGHTTSALVTHLLQLLHTTASSLNEAKENISSLKEEHDQEKQEMLRLIYRFNATFSSAAEAASASMKGTTSSASETKGSSTNDTLSVPVEKKGRRDLSPKRQLQAIVDEERLDEVPKDDESMPRGGFLCLNCRTIVICNVPKNNKRCFEAHLQKCSNFDSENGLNEYPAPLEENKTEEREKVATAVLSIAADKDASKEDGKDTLRHQLKVVSLAEGQDYKPMKDVTIAGIDFFHDLTGCQETLVEPVAVYGPESGDAKEEPEAPEPFEYIEY